MACHRPDSFLEQIKPFRCGSASPCKSRWAFLIPCGTFLGRLSRSRRTLPAPWDTFTCHLGSSRAGSPCREHGLCTDAQQSFIFCLMVGVNGLEEEEILVSVVTPL